jgi:hypothetical protein
MGQTAKPCVPLNVVCMFCGATAKGEARDLDRAGWDWYTGYTLERKEVCPKCKASSRRQDWDAHIKRAMQRPEGWPASSSAYKKRPELVALLRRVLDAHDAPLAEGVSVLLPRELIEDIRGAIS